MTAPFEVPWAEATVTIDATVDPDLRGIAGMIRVDTTEDFRLVDPLAELPLPASDRAARQVSAGRAERGEIEFERLSDDTWRFSTALPRRWEDLGTSSHGLFANGAWYPTPVFDPDLPVLRAVDWVVRVGLPEGSAGALGDVAGSGDLYWSGTAERVALAVVPRGVVTPIVEDQLSIALVTRGSPRHRLVRELGTELSRARPERLSWTVAVAEAPLRRRLARSGPGLAYVSDRAFRVSPPLVRFHRPAVVRAVVQSALEVDLPEWRALSAAAIARRYTRTLPGLSADRALRLGAFSPHVEALLYDQRMPFYGDVLDRTQPSDPLRDDLVDRWWPHEPAPAVIAQLEALEGPLAVDVVWRAYAGDGVTWQTFSDLGLHTELEVLDRPWPAPHDLTLSVDRDRGVFTVTRDDTPGDAEVVPLLVDGDADAALLAPGESVERPLADARHLAVDPRGVLALTHRSDDRWPRRSAGTIAGGVYTLDPADGVVIASAQATFRPAQDTHLRGLVTAWADRTTQPGLELGAAYQFGRPVDGLRRIERIAVSAGARRFDPRYVPVEPDRSIALAAGLSWRHDTRDEAFFPMHGARVAAYVEAGRVLGGDAGGAPLGWTNANATAMTLLAAHPRAVLAVSAEAGLGSGQVPHEQLSFGGDSGLLAVPPTALFVDRRAIARAEWRFAVVRGASVPVVPALLWAQELQLSVGAEAGVARSVGPTPHTPWAVGVTAGASVIGDWFGVDPAMVGVTAALPARAHGVEAPLVPQWTLRFAQPW